VAIFFWPLRGPLLIAISDGRNTRPIPNLELLSLITNGAFVLMTASIAVAALAVFARYRRSWTRGRVQLRWFLYATAIVGADLIVGAVAGIFSVSWLHAIGTVLDAIALPCLPIAAGIAILRHRLYDIDVIINQTLVYGTLTATLAAISAGAVASLQALLRLVAQPHSPLPTVAATLAIAFLFQPLRQRIQHGIDRRFYRRKYDLRQTLAVFAAELRDEVDLDAISDRLIIVLEETMQPASISLWLRAPQATRLLDVEA